jgi:hypothetical protein
MAKTRLSTARKQYRVNVTQGMEELWEWTEQAPPGVSIPAEIAFYARLGRLRWLELTGRSAGTAEAAIELTSTKLQEPVRPRCSPPAPSLAGDEEAGFAVFGGVGMFDGPPLVSP